MSFGDGSQGALGLPTFLTGLGADAYEPTQVPGLPSDVTSLTAGHYHSLAVTSEGQLWAWGRDNEAQLGRGVLSPRSIPLFLFSDNVFTSLNLLFYACLMSSNPIQFELERQIIYLFSKFEL